VRADAEKGHHATVEEVGELALHLHVNVFDEHAVDDGDGFEVHRELIQLRCMILYFIHLLLHFQVVVTLVASSLPLEAANALFDVSFNLTQFVLGFFLGPMDFTIDFVVQFCVFVDHLLFELADLDLNDLVGLLDLEVGDLRTKWLQLFTHFFDELTLFLSIQLDGASHHLHHGTSGTSFRSASTARSNRT